jgi:ATP-binding cassette subfamily B protein
VVIVVAALSAGLPLAAQRLLIERDLKVRTHTGALTRYFLDALRGLVAVRCHRAEPAIRREHEALLVEWKRSSLALLGSAVAVEGVLAAAGAICAVTVLGHHLGRVGDSGVALLLLYWVLELPALGRELAGVVRLYPTQRNVLLRVMEPLSAPLEPAPTEVAEVPAEPAAGVAVVLRSVSVVAGGHTLLRDVDLRLEPSCQVAVVGGSGAGKSTLLGLLLGWHRPAAGTLEIDGRPLTDEALHRLRRQTVWIDPSVWLWNRSIEDNLRYGAGGRSSDSLAAVLAEADLHDVLGRLPHGLQTLAGEGGGMLSGGEGQRVRLGRALLRDPVRLVLLDEAFRGLPRDRRRELLAAARGRWPAATLLCATHDLGETPGFDHVVVVADGRVVEQGRPAELMVAPGSRYRRMLEREQEVLGRAWDAERWRVVELADGRLQGDGAVR